MRRSIAVSVVRAVLHKRRAISAILNTMKAFIHSVSITAALAAVMLMPSGVTAQEVHQDLVEVVRATVLTIVSEDTREIMGTDATALVQEVRVRIDTGEMKGKTATFENDVTEVGVGDKIYIQRLVAIDGSEYYTFKDFYRIPILIYLALSFIALLWVIAGGKGLKALLSLVGSILVIIYVLVPLLLAGYDPVLSAVGIAGVMLAIAIFVTHGIGAQARIAFLGTFAAIIVTGALAVMWVTLARLTGFASDAAIYLNFSTQGSLDFSGLLLGSILIGVIGVLDDVAITQASVVVELARANSSLSRYELYRRALRVGRDHIGSLVNTLALAYVGVSLPLLLLFARTESSFIDIINQEVVASEIVRTLVGSLGLMLAVPATTALAVWWVKRYGIPHDHGHDHGHHHGHSH